MQTEWTNSNEIYCDLPFFSNSLLATCSSCWSCCVCFFVSNKKSMKIHILMILGCCEEGDHFDSNKIETSGVSIKSVSFLSLSQQLEPNEIGAHIALKHDVSKHFSDSISTAHWIQMKSSCNRESGKWSSKIEQRRFEFYFAICLFSAFFSDLSAVLALRSFLLTLWVFDVILKLTHIYKCTLERPAQSSNCVMCADRRTRVQLTDWLFSLSRYKLEFSTEIVSNCVFIAF